MCNKDFLIDRCGYKFTEELWKNKLRNAGYTDKEIQKLEKPKENTNEDTSEEYSTLV